MQYSITRALAELTKLEKRINSTIDQGIFVGTTKGGKADSRFESIEDLENTIKSSYDSVEKLIQRRQEIKSKIVASNASTYVEVADQKMTVAEAIERKSSISFEQKYLVNLRKQYTNVIDATERENQKVENYLQQLLESLVGKEEARKGTSKDNELIENKKKEMTVEIAGGKAIKAKIDNLAISIEDFLTNVDYVLSESNTLTTIEVQD